MELKFFRVPVYESDAAEAQLNAFLRQHRIISLDRHLIENGLSSVWSVCVQYEVSSGGPGKTPGNTSMSKEEIRQSLGPQAPCFDRLVELRKRLSKDSGVAAYQVFTNQQLAAIVRGQITTKKALATIQGVGDGRVDKFGEPFLRVVADWLREQSTSSPAPSAAAKETRSHGSDSI